MKKRHVNLGRTDENIADQYPNIFEGIQKDAAQNAWDARLTKKGKDWKLVFKYIHERNILIIEDFGTTGMNTARWLNYQSLWDTTKTLESSLGARGQGKFLFHYFSTEKLVLTETIDSDRQYRFSYGTTAEWDDTTKALHDFVPGAPILDHQGTRIWIMNLKSDILEGLLDHTQFARFIAATWWEIIRDYGAVFLVDFDGIERKVVLPDLPQASKTRRFERERIKDFGEIKKFELHYCKEAVPQHFRGIAIQRGGMTILRLPVKAEDSVRERIYGYCNFNNALEAELKQVEQPNHFGFTNKRVWNHTKEYLSRRIDEFVQEISPKKRKVEIEAKLLNEATKIVNELLAQYAPELTASPKGHVTKKKEKPIVRLPKPPVRIDIFRSNAKRYEYNESLKIECEIANETDHGRELSFCLEIRHQCGTLKHKSRYAVKLDPMSRCPLSMPLIDFEEGSDGKGKYKVDGELRDAKGNDLIHNRRFYFYLGEEPPPMGKAFMTQFEIIYTGKKLFFERWRNLPISDKGIIRAIWDHPDFVYVRERASSKKAKKREILLYLVKIGIEEGIKQLTIFRNNEAVLDLEEIKRLYNMRDEMYYDCVSRVI